MRMKFPVIDADRIGYSKSGTTMAGSVKGTEIKRLMETTVEMSCM